ncbi:MULTISPECIES: hypothetical protein [Flavobacteriaceae]|uniref:hypothetical protein n=1 Tax=Flavobacteriaceae TaxID=49546 RepID=UPI00351618E4
MSEFTEKNYQEGYNLSLELIDELGFKTEDNPSVEHFAGIFTCLFNLLYVHQSKDEVDKVVSMAQKFAYEDAMKELNKR